MCLATFKNFIVILFNRSIERGAAKSNAMSDNLNKYINQM